LVSSCRSGKQALVNFSPVGVALEAAMSMVTTVENLCWAPRTVGNVASSASLQR
jgi:hypothetical protein